MPTSGGSGAATEQTQRLRLRVCLGQLRQLQLPTSGCCASILRETGSNFSWARFRPAGVFQLLISATLHALVRAERQTSSVADCGASHPMHRQRCHHG